MIDLGAIWASAVAEMRVTRRLVRYWIFTALAFALFLIAYGYYALLHGAFSFFSATIAWLNPRFLLGAFGFWYCFVLMVGAVFLAFEVRGRDTRERISEVLDVRPITNLELLFGRMLGIVLMVWLPTFVISAVVYVIGVIVKAPIQPISLLSFIFVMTLPAFLFVIPLTFLVTLVVRVRLVAAVAVLALLGASVVTLFWTPIAWGTAFDISGSTALDLPSDVAPLIVREPGQAGQRDLESFPVLLVPDARGALPRHALRPHHRHRHRTNRFHAGAQPPLPGRSRCRASPR
ncbi:MAG: ABC transporter permease [Acidobacteria bacterium]|nr:ABC transporter permease [Acidobacteriota bacterium]